jgi:hypothetical protein
MKARKQITALAALFAAGVLNTQAQVVITEVDANGSSATDGYAADWFEVQNLGASSVDLSTWKMDDNSDNFSLAVPLHTAALSGLNSTLTLSSGQIAVFLEDTGAASDTTLAANFTTAWFGASVPSSLNLVFYGGSGVGLSGTADAVNLFDGSGNPMAGVTFGATTAGHTFDNAAGLSGPISQVSQVGTGGAFTGANGEVGSPGAVPEPSALALFGMGAALLGMIHRRKK